RLFIIVIVALRPLRFGQRRILPIPGPLVLLRCERTLQRIGASISEGLVKTADAVMRGSEKHQIAWRPRVEITMSKDTRHSESCHLRNVMPPDHLPFVRQDRIEPCVVGLITDRVVV